MDFRDICETAIRATGAFRDPWVEDAFTAVDRAAFIPAVVWSQHADPDGRYPVLDRGTDPDAWYQAAWHPHHSVITQLDDHRAPDVPASGRFTSSVSAPDIVCEKLCQLDLKPGHRVLEIGTGSGYSTALLCHRVGDRNVTSIEIDPGLSAGAAKTLSQAGYHPRLLRADGLAGDPDGGPYDRVIATAAVRYVPGAWVEQCAPNAVILTPFGTSYANGGLLRLAAHDGTATGRFVGTALYMWVRAQRPNMDLHPPAEARRRASPLDPAEILQGPWAQDFAIGLAVQDIAVTHRGAGDLRQAQLWDEDGTSVTIIRYARWWDPTAVTVYGPRDLWAEVTAAYTMWRTVGQPGPPRYGLTVTADHQRIWLDTPDRTVSPPPA